MKVKRTSEGQLIIPKGYRRLAGFVKVRRGDYYLSCPGSLDEAWDKSGNIGLRVNQCFRNDTKRRPYIRKI